MHSVQVKLRVVDVDNALEVECENVIVAVVADMVWWMLYVVCD